MSVKSEFIKALKETGFKKVNNTKYSYEHEKRLSWYAEELDDRVWITGNGLIKNSDRYPGGWVYSDPQEFKQDILKALDL